MVWHSCARLVLGLSLCVVACEERDACEEPRDAGADGGCEGRALDASAQPGPNAVRPPRGSITDEEAYCPTASGSVVARANALRDLDYYVRRWGELTTHNGERYWYVETNCDAATGAEHRTYVEVDGDDIVRVEEQTRSGCIGCVYRAEAFEPRTMPDLLSACRDLIESAAEEHTVTVEADETGTIFYCRVRDVDCNDGRCDLGFHIPYHAFGPLTDDVFEGP